MMSNEGMTSLWPASTPLADGSGFQGLHSGLTIRMIMIPRPQFMVCRPVDELPAVIARNLDRFSYIPVVGKGDEFLGLLRAENWFDQSAPGCLVDDHFERLSEHMLIGADASILDFVQLADNRPCCLVVSGRRIEGLVSLSDLQKLPVRAALFALVTGLELTMAQVISARFATPCEWMRLLCEEKRKKMARSIRRAKRNDGYVDHVLFTEFGDKSKILLDSTKNRILTDTLTDDFDNIRLLRNSLAHANQYAQSPRKAKHVAFVTRRIIQLQADLAKELGR